MSGFVGVPAEAAFVPLLPLQLAMKKYRGMTGLQLVPPRVRNPERVWGTSSALGLLSQPWQKGRVLWSDAEASQSEPLHFGARAGTSPTPLDQEIARWPETGHVLSCIAPGNLPALHAGRHPASQTHGSARGLAPGVLVFGHQSSRAGSI